jgi:hypothetical protein
MPTYIFILHERDVVLTKFEHELPDDDAALDVALVASKYSDVDVWAGEKVVAQLSKGDTRRTTVLGARYKTAS